MQWNQDFLDAYAEAILDEINTAIGSAGVIEFRTGAPPTNPTDSDTGTLIVTLTCDAPPFNPTVVSNVAQLNDTAPEVAVASGTVGHFRMKDNTDVCIFQGTCGDAGGVDINFDDADFTIGDVCVLSILSLTFAVTP